MGKLIRAVLRGWNGGNTVLLPDHYEKDGKDHKLYGFAAVLSYSRKRFIAKVSHCDTPTMIRCMLEAFEYFGGLAKAALTDRMKSVAEKKQQSVLSWLILIFLHLLPLAWWFSIVKVALFVYKKRKQNEREISDFLAREENISRQGSRVSRRHTIGAVRHTITGFDFPLVVFTSIITVPTGLLCSDHVLVLNERREEWLYQRALSECSLTPT